MEKDLSWIWRKPERSEGMEPRGSWYMPLSAEARTAPNSHYSIVCDCGAAMWPVIWDMAIGVSKSKDISLELSYITLSRKAYLHRQVLSSTLCRLQI